MWRRQEHFGSSGTRKINFKSVASKVISRSLKEKNHERVGKTSERERERERESKLSASHQERVGSSKEVQERSIKGALKVSRQTYNAPWKSFSKCQEQ